MSVLERWDTERDPGEPGSTAATRVGAIVAEQVRAITLAAEESAADIRRRAEEEAELTHAAAGEMRARMERLEEVVLELVASRRREAEVLSRLLEQGQLGGPEREGRLALPPASEEPRAPSAPDSRPATEEEQAGEASPSSAAPTGPARSAVPPTPSPSREAVALPALTSPGRRLRFRLRQRLRAQPPSAERDGTRTSTPREVAEPAEPRADPGPPAEESAEIGPPAPSAEMEPSAASAEPAGRPAPASRPYASDDALLPGDREGPTAPTGDRPTADAPRENGRSTGERRGHPSERDANVGVLLSRIRTRRSSASVDCPPCTVCRRDFGGSIKQAEEDGWRVIGEEALCDRCASAGWRLPDDSPHGRGAGRG